MDRDQFAPLSFIATIAFAILAIALLGLAGFVLGDAKVLFLALATAGLSYAAQFLFTLACGAAPYPEDKMALAGQVLQAGAVLVFLYGALYVLGQA